MSLILFNKIHTQTHTHCHLVLLAFEIIVAEPSIRSIGFLTKIQTNFKTSIDLFKSSRSFFYRFAFFKCIVAIFIAK